ncbi:transmembrane protein KIAA1109 homolog isoform X4 [Octopus sinensis]|uniref:Transmembrane protein KIAA1109 homolog isoform X4 n=1 Tax=Octopus sinensis TaxID=2607531 RepID=A0A7E6F9F3_9MOLL|nr:transmembrane protein KIAA1109 homolog isoform X4 [Octopus sinensis]
MMMMMMSNANSSLFERIEDELPQSSLYWLLIALCAVMMWTIYITYYNSRVLGLILTVILNKFVHFGHVKFGSFSFSVLSGKIMFRDVHLVTEDFSVRVQYGWAIFRWWRPYVHREINEDLSHCETRLSLFLEGFEFHVYNRSFRYSLLEKLFGLEPDMIPEEEKEEDTGVETIEDNKNNVEPKRSLHWRDLIPVIKVDINSARIIFGNYLIPTTLTVNFDEAHIVYTTKPASTPFDQFMHVMKCRAENARVMLVPSPKYNGPIDVPPRNMGEGFVVLQSRDVEMYYYMDEPGLVPHEPELVHLADGEVIVRRTYPCFGFDLKCGKNTDFNYGSWADRQREHLWKFFFPADYQPLQPTRDPSPGERRQYKAFEFRMSIIAKATVDILFTKNSVNQAIHMNTGQGSYVEANIPWIIGETGYTTKITGQLLLLDATTSLQFRSLVDCETFEFSISATYPIIWNSHQDWQIDFTACKATVYLIYDLKSFFSDLTDDWSSRQVPDIYHFVPYTWHINLIIKEFELVALANQHNWIDTSSQNQENIYVAFCGDMFDLSIQLPYDDFLPPKVATRIFIRGESMDCRLFLPETVTSRHVIKALSENMKILDRDGNVLEKGFPAQREKWRKLTQKSADWIDCWTTPIAALSITYTYHPMPLLHVCSDPVAGLEENINSGLELEEALLIPLRPLRQDMVYSKPPDDFDPVLLEPDVINLELEVGPSVLCLYGSLLLSLWNIKENYFGEDQHFTDFYNAPKNDEENDVSFPNLSTSEERSGSFDPRKYRPLSVTFSVTLHDMQIHLIKNCNVDEVPCPCLYVERLGFEMDKSYKETKLQLLISPSLLLSRDSTERDAEHAHIHEGHLALSGLQVRGHAMFSGEGLPLDRDTIEYAWLVEVIVGSLSGRLTSPQVQSIVEFLETFIMLVDDSENILQSPIPYRMCQHGLPQPQCRMFPQYPFCCPSPEDIKYRMTRASVDSINLHFVEFGSSSNLQISPIRFSTCNLHGITTRAGVTGFVEQITLTQYISTAPMRQSNGQPEVWLECGQVSFGPINIEAAMALPNLEFHKIQDDFLKSHDRKTRRLWFLWRSEVPNVTFVIGRKCGCLGGCKFFGNNKNGLGFFHPKKFSSGNSNAAVFQIFPKDADPGFGQSLLCRNKLMFETNNSKVPGSPETYKGLIFTRGYMSTFGSPDTPTTNVTLVDSLQKQMSVAGEQPQEKQADDSGDEDDDTSHSSSTVTSNTHGPTSKTSADVSKNIDEQDKSLSITSDGFSLADPVSLNSLTEETEFGSCSSGPVCSGDYARHGSLASSNGSVYSYPSSPSSGFARLHSMTQSSTSAKTGSPTRRYPWSSPETGRSRCTSGEYYTMTSMESDRYFTADDDGTMSETELQRFFYRKPVFQDVKLFGQNSGTVTNEKPAENQKRDRSRSFDVNGTTSRSKKRPKSTHSSTSSSSTLSFMSAISSPDDITSNIVLEDLSMVDLHGQMNQPITKSPVLMSCYLNHLTHMHCTDWAAPSPFATTHTKSASFKGLKQDTSFFSHSSLTYAPCRFYPKQSWVPHFSKVKQGFSVSMMKPRDEIDVPQTPLLDGPTDPWNSFIEEEEAFDSAEVVISENTSKTTAVIKLKGSVDILLTPLLLESTQRYIEAITPVLSKLHPSSIIDRLHSRCLDRLKQKNRLKKHSSDEIHDSNSSRREPMEMKTSSIQAYFSLSKINVCILQTSIVEELVSFSALDNIHDFTCVSLLAVCISNIECQLLSNCHSCKIANDNSPSSSLHHSTNLLVNKEKSSKGATNTVGAGTGTESTNTECYKLSETSKDENVGTLSIEKIHFQFRRLLKHSNFSENVILTAIPEFRSKVLFVFDKENIPCESKQSTLSRESSQTSGREYRQKSDELGIGFIMFECGMEGINLTAVRRLGFKENVDTEFQHKMEEIEKTLEEMQEQTKTELDKGEVPKKWQDKKNSMSSWDSTMSITSSDSQFPSLERLTKMSPLEGDASSGVLKLETIWFNFAAPPPLPMRRKMDFTRLDWNLLSTATPAINSWLNPTDHLIVAIKQLRDALTHRNCSVMACIMTEALEVQSIHMPYKRKFNKLNGLSKILQEDPSCQLFTVLRKYVKSCGISPIETAVKSDTIPQLITIQKGILALTRQWKTVLYMPHLADMHLKSKKAAKPYTVAFTLPVMDASNNFNMDDTEMPIEHFDIVDERTSLLLAEGGSIHQSLSMPSLSGHSIPVPPSLAVNHPPQGPVIITSCPDDDDDNENMNRPTKRKQVVTESPEPYFHLKPAFATNSPMTRNESTYSFVSAAGSMSSLEHGLNNTPPQTPLRVNFPRSMPLGRKSPRNGDNLYEWMAQQQNRIGNHFTNLCPSSRRQDSIMTAFASNFGSDESKVGMSAEHLTLATSILQLADAQMLFKPFLESIGLHVEGVRTSALMKKFGGHLSLQGRLNTMKIQIAESSDLTSKGKGKSKTARFIKVINTSADNPAFLCEDFVVNIGMRDVVDFEKNKGKDERKYVSWKFAMHKLEAKPTTLKVNFMINCHSVTQHVDMPLLRLIHQFVTMIDNINETRVELKQNRPADSDWQKTHRKQDSKDSTSSADTQQSHTSKTLPTEQDTPTPDASVSSDVSSHDGTKIITKRKNKQSPKVRVTQPLESKRPDKLPLMSLRRTHLRFSGKSKKSGSRSQQSSILTPPHSLNLSDSVTIDMGDTSSPVFAEKTIVDEIKESTPRCWRTLYHLLELYSTMPTTKTLGRKPSMLPAIAEEENEKETSKNDSKSLSNAEEGVSNTAKNKPENEESTSTNLHNRSVIGRSTFKQSFYIGETIPLVVFGIAKVEKFRILAALSGLKLDAELKCVHASGAYREKVKGFVGKSSSESSITAHIGHTRIGLLEGILPNMTIVVTVDVNKSQGLYTSVVRRSKKHNSALISIGAIDVDIPQHPVVLHGMMARSSKQLSTTFQEFRRTAQKSRQPDISESINPEVVAAEIANAAKMTSDNKAKTENPMKTVTLHIHFKAILQGLTIGASLLPSLRAHHKTSPITVTGMTGKKARFTIDLPAHTLSFKSRVSSFETSIPSSASIDLPPIHVYADYRHHKATSTNSDNLTDGLVLKEGGYLNAVAEVGMLEHSLTTDLLNHVVFVQKVFMKEVNELVQKVSGSDQPIRIWTTNEGTTMSKIREPLLYSLLFRLKGIQITATTPTSNAVRLETGSIDLEVSNRVQLASRESKSEYSVYENNQKVFIRAHIDLNLTLGQLLKNPLFEEAEPEFQTMAYFKTKIGIRNAIQDEMIPGQEEDQEALLITLTRPIILAQPQDFDKAVLVWLNYRNAYEYWTEQRMALNREVQTATRQVIDKLPQLAPSAHTNLTTLFLQLTVDDMGICLPIHSYSQNGTQNVTRFMEIDVGTVLVLTIENTQISACSSGSLVSKGRFTGFCLRFADDFETSWDEWKPVNKEDSPIMNACVVPEGTYEVCSRTINKQATDPPSNAKWILNVLWEMEGIDVHLDTNIGKKLSGLAHTLTALAGDPNDDDAVDILNEADSPDGTMSKLPWGQHEAPTRRQTIAAEHLPAFVFDTTLEPKVRARLIEKEMNEQAIVVQDLKQLGASQSVVDIEIRKLEGLQMLLFNDFRRDVLNKLKKQGEKASVLKDTLGLGHKPTHSRSKSFGGHHPRRHHRSSPDTNNIFDFRNGSSSIQEPMRHHSLRCPVSHRPYNLHDILSSSSEASLSSDEELSLDQKEPFQPLHPAKVLSHSLEKVCSVYLPLTSDGRPFDNSKQVRYQQSSTPTPSSSSKVGSVPPGSAPSGSATAASTAASSASSSNTPDPSVDFELDFKVFINSGKWILHPKDNKEEDLKKGVHKKPETSPVTGRKKMKRQDSNTTLFTHTSHTKKGPPVQPPAVENTVFFLPGLDVRVHYNSKTSALDSPAAKPGMPTVNLVPETTPEKDKDKDTISTPSSKRSNVKKANLYAWVFLQSLPEEMIISPYLLDFLEQALEPLPLSQPFSTKKAELVGQVLMDLDASTTSLGLPAAYASFPVDVVVFIRVDSSVIRFNCAPMSRVECMIQVPSLETVFSTKGTDENVIGEGTPPLKAKNHKRSPSVHRERNYSGNQDSSTGSSGSTFGGTLGHGGMRPRVSSTASEYTSQAQLTSSGGLSFTACLTNFSLYIFHPYGGGQRKQQTVGSPGYLGGFQKSELGCIQEHGGNLFTEFTRKDSLSLNVEFIKVHISRSRKLDVRLGDPMFTGSSSTMSQPPQPTPTTGGVRSEGIKSNCVRFSAICDIGSASFKYDMRRLSEILSFPKAWYRRNLARRMFLGDESVAQAASDEDVFSSSCSSSVTSESPQFVSVMKSLTSPALHIYNGTGPLIDQDYSCHDSNGHLSGQLSTASSKCRLAGPMTSGSKNYHFKKHHRRASSGDKWKIQVSQELKAEIAKFSGKGISASVPPSPDAPNLDTVSAPPPKATSSKNKSGIGQYFSPELGRHRNNSGHQTAGVSTAWETLVLFAVNLSTLDVNVNMSNVMGNTTWATKDIKSQGRLSIDSFGHKNMKVTAGLGSSMLVSKGGVVGGTIDLQDLHTYFTVLEDPEQGNPPDHQSGLSLFAAEARLDYMGSSVLMTRISSLKLHFRDEWLLDADMKPDMPLATKRPAILFVHGTLDWDKFHIMISRSTTPDLLKMAAKLEEFFTTYLTNSKRVLSAFGPIGGSMKSKSSTKRKNSEDLGVSYSSVWHHRHWQKVLVVAAGCSFSMLPSPLPKEGTILGGTVTLKGNNLSLACFHGFNFRSKSWAIFTINEPDIIFATEAQKSAEGGTCIVQDLTFRVGHDTTQHISEKNMATICKLSRGHYMPPPFTSVREWFHYAFASAEIKDLDTFPAIQHDKPESPTEHKKSRKTQDYSHDREIIFAFPSMQMHFKTKHFQGEHEPSMEEDKPIVECSFITEFEDHISVAMDAEVIWFLHDLVSSYIKEKDKSTARLGFNASTKANSGIKSPEMERKKLIVPTVALKQDWRQFECKTWHLEPTVRLVHWASRQIDPIGVDYILQKLGFSHARVTIPKWMQRGFMDPMDKMLAVLVNKLMIVLRDKPNAADEDT